jgi:hypothetical protein
MQVWRGKNNSRGYGREEAKKIQGGNGEGFPERGGEKGEDKQAGWEPALRKAAVGDLQL